MKHRPATLTDTVATRNIIVVTSGSSKLEEGAQVAIHPDGIALTILWSSPHEFFDALWINTVHTVCK